MSTNKSSLFYSHEEEHNDRQIKKTSKVEMGKKKHTTAVVNVRNSPGGESVEVYPKGKEVTVYSEDGEWSKIERGYWIKSIYLK